MALSNWSMTLIGYHAHARSGSRVIGVSHMSTFAAMLFAQELGIRGGWLLADGSQPQLEGVRANHLAYVELPELFAHSRVVKTEGLASGTLIFAGAPRDAGMPPGAEALVAWAEGRNQPWVEVRDNEHAYWGGLDEAQSARLLTWFLCQRPLDADWRKVRIEPRTLARLRHGLIDHGWTRNLELVKADRGLCELWGGVHRSCVLEHQHQPLPSRVQTGLRLRLELGEFSGKDLGEGCPVNDETGKAVLVGR